MTQRTKSFVGVRADDSREVALIDKAEIDSDGREIPVPVRQALERDRQADAIPELRERHPGGPGKDAADVKSRVPDRLRQLAQVRAGGVRDDRLTSVLDDAVVVVSGC